MQFYESDKVLNSLFDANKKKIDDPWHNSILSFAFLTNHLCLAELFPSKSGLEKPNLP